MLSSIIALASVASLVAARPISVALAAVETALSLPTTTQLNNASFYWQQGNAGACGWYSNDTDLVVGLPEEFYSDLGAVSPYCGAYILINNAINNVSTAARVADASAANGTLSLSVGTWRALQGDATNLTSVTWRFANKNETSAAEAAVTVASQAAASADAAAKAAAASAGTVEATSSDASDAVAAVTTTTSAYVAPTTTTTTSVYVAPTTTSVYVAPTTTSVYVAPTTTSVYVAPTTTTTVYVAPKTTTTTTVYVAPKTTTTYAAATTTVKASSASSGTYSGTATYFTQGGVAGNCGSVHSDSDYIVALTSSMYSSGSHCGQTVKICTSSGSCISATVADSCPTCSSSGDLDLSVGAFSALASLDAGVVGITWSFA